MRQAPLKAQKPTEEEVELTEVFIAQNSTPPDSANSLPSKLPATASSLPLIALAGVIALFVSGAIAFAERRAR
jgi:hypothetical protein